MIISTDAEEAFDKIQHSLVIKTLSKLEVEGNFLNLIRTIYKKTTTNIILNGEKLKALRQGCCPLSALLFNVELKSVLMQ